MSEKLTREERKQKRALRSYRGRFIKNLLIWLLGVVFGFTSLFAGIGVAVGVVPIGNYLGKDSEELVSKDIAKQSLLQALLHISEYGIKDVPVLEDLVKKIIDDTAAHDYVEVDYEKLESLNFGDANFVDELASCFTVTASLNSIGGASVLGDLGKLSIFSQYDLVTETIDPTATGFNAKLYYYKHGEKYARAFTNDGQYVGGVTQSTPLYYPNLSEVPLLDAKDMITASFSRLNVVNLMNVAGANIGETGLLHDILDGKKISDLGSLSADSILLTDVLPKNTNAGLYDILEGLFGINDQSTIGSLGNISINNDMVVLDMLGAFNVTLDSTNPLYAILDGKTIGDLTNLEVNGILLTSILPEKDYSSLYDILEKLFGIDKTTATIGSLGSLSLGSDMVVLDVIEAFNVSIATDSLFYKILDGKTLADLSSLTTDEILDTLELESMLLKDLLAPSSNQGLYDLLKDVFGLDQDTVTVGDLKSLSVDGDMNVLDMLKAFDVTIASDSALYAILNGKKLSDLSSLNEKDILLKDLLKPSENAKLYELLEKLFGIKQETATVGSLGSLSVQNTIIVLDLLDSLEVEIATDSIIYKILNGKTLADLSNMEMKDILDSVGINDMLLKDILTPSSNVKLYQMLKDIFGLDQNTVKVGDLSSLSINSDMLVLDMLKAFDIEIDSSNVLYNILKGKTIGNMSNIKIEDMLLKDVLLPENNEKLYELLQTLFDINPEQAKVSALGSLSINQNVEILNMLETFDITIGSNTLAYKLLNGKKLSELKDISADTLTLGDVFAESSNGNIYSILNQAVELGENYSSVSEMPLSQINTNFKIGNIRLGLVLSEGENGTFYSILNESISVPEDYKDANGNPTTKVSDMKLSDVNKYFSIENIKLGTALNEDNNPALYSILKEAISLPAGVSSIGELRLKDINTNFSIDNVTLGTALNEEENPELYSILKEAIVLPAGVESISQLKLSQLNGCFAMENICLDTLLEGVEVDNGILKALKGKGIKVKDLGSELEKLSISEIYEINCFTRINTGSARYSKVDNDYVLDSNGIYYISNDGGIWLFLLYKTENVQGVTHDENGNAKKYVYADLTLGDMQSGVGDVASAVMNATIRELVNAGIIDDTNFNNPLIYTMTMAQVIEKIGNPTGTK